MGEPMDYKYNVFKEPGSRPTGKLEDLFPLHPLHDFDSTFPHVTWPIGFYAEYPKELRKRLSAALISTQMGLKSADYVAKAYLNDIEEEDPIREDLEISRFLREVHSFLYGVVHELTHHDDDCIGRILAEWALLRQEFSFLQLLVLANRGALFEGFAVARMQVEQLAWICAVDREVDAEKVKNVQAQASIAKLKVIEPRIGRLYGYLSDHAHWGYGAHVKALVRGDEGLGVLFASVHHKIELYMVALLLADTFGTIVFSLRSNEISALQRGDEYIEKRSEISNRIRQFYTLLDLRLDGNLKYSSQPK